MGKIILLDENTSNKIAAGEVIENPASVVKELVENSMDAGADSIQVEIKDGGKTFIKIVDNGYGFEDDDVELAFERHATSKIRKPDDIESISTFGFRGEALASIAAVSNVEVITRTKNSDYGKLINIQGGEVKDVKTIGCQNGTTFVIKDLFYNTPARFKFLKKDKTESGYVSDIICRVSLGNPHISFKLTVDGKTVLHTPGNNDLQSTVFSIYGKETANSILKIVYKNDFLEISGLIGKGEIARANRNQQSVYINHRYIKSKVVTAAIDEACKSFLMKNRYAFAVLYLDINPTLVDVNVHPAKMEVRFSNESEIFKSVYSAITNTLYNRNEAPEVKVIKDEVKIESNKSIGNCEKSISDDEKALNPTIIPDMKPIIKSNIPAINYRQTHVFDTFQNIKKEKTPPVKEFGYTEGRNISVGRDFEEDEPQRPQTDGAGIKNKPNIGSRELINEDSTQVYVKNDQDGVLLTEARIIGQLFSTYIILENRSELILVDQHAAHERIMYEKLRVKYHNRESLSQILFDSEVIEVTYQEQKFLEDVKDVFQDLGFTYENFGNNSIVLRSVPYIMENGQVKQKFLEVLDYLMNSLDSGSKIIPDEKLYSIACRIAVKANKKLDNKEIENMLSELKIMENPFNCPHGRPTIIKISRYEIEKMFKRKL